MNKQKIDLVYTWVDNNDKNWQKKYNSFNIKYNEKIFNARYSNHDELKYSLRSVEKFAPWISNIYIVTDNQIPKWLNLNNPKITIIDHKKIIPNEYLPTFNSIVIEHCIKNIPNLSEYFLYANDDMFFFDDVTPDFFFLEDGKIINRYHKKFYDIPDDAYLELIKNGVKLLRKKYGNIPLFEPHHNIDGYRKSVIESCYRDFKDTIDNTMDSKFRERFDIPRFIYNDYSCLTAKGVYRQMQEDSLYIDAQCPFDIEQYLLEHKPKLLCFNDIQSSTQANRELYIKILEKYFPIKSEYEL